MESFCQCCNRTYIWQVMIILHVACTDCNQLLTALNWIHSKDNCGLELLVSAVKSINGDMHACRWMRRQIAQTDSAYTETVHGAVAAQQLANAPMWMRTDRWAAGLYCCFVLFISTKVWHWTYYSACVLFVGVEPYKPTYSTETPQALLHMLLLSQYRYNQFRVAPSIP